VAGLSAAVGKVDENRGVLPGGYVRQGWSSAGSRTREMTSEVSSNRRTTRYGAYRGCRVNMRPLVEPSLVGDQLGSEEPVDLVPGGSHFRVTASPRTSPTAARRWATHDGVLLRPYA
jgi:hypothetical protein